MKQFEPLTRDLPIEPDRMWHEMHDRFLHVANATCPLKDFKIRHDKPPYLRGDTNSEMSIRDKLFRVARSKTGNNLAWAKARKQKLKVRKLIRSSKRNYIGKELAKNAKDSKKDWRTVNTLMKNTYRQHLDSVICPVGGVKLIGMEAACLMNKFFCEIGELLVGKIPDESHSFTPPRTNCVFEWSCLIGENEVLKRVEELNIEKSSGIPKLGSKILKECLRHSVSDFTYLLNPCIKLGKFPMAWKRAMVVPIPKGNKKLIVENIRPISLLPYPGKILEQILH